MALMFVRSDAGLPERVGYDGECLGHTGIPKAPFRVDGYCPFLTCTQDGAHVHPVCWLCEAVNFGNLFCGACARLWIPSRGFLQLRLLQRVN